MTSRVLCRVNRLLEQRAATRPVLGLDTSTPIASLAVIAHGTVAASVARPVTSHGAALPGAVDELLGAAGLAIGGLGAIAVVGGHGSGPVRAGGGGGGVLVFRCLFAGG